MNRPSRKIPKNLECYNPQMPDAFSARSAPKRHCSSVRPTRKSHCLAALSLFLVLAPASRALTPAQDPRALIEQAKDQYRNGHFADAIAGYLAALKIAPRNITAEVQLAEAYRAVHNEKEARGLLEQSAREHPKSAAPLAVLGDLEIELQTYDAAIKHLSAAVALDPANNESRDRLAAAYKSKGDAGAALAQLTKSLAAIPTTHSPISCAPKSTTTATMTRGRYPKPKSPHATAAKSQRPHDTREDSYPYVRDSRRRNCNSRLRARRRARTTHR